MIIFTYVNKNYNIFNNTKCIRLFNKYSNFIFDDVDNDYYEYKKFKNYFIRYLYIRYLLTFAYFNYSGDLHREDGPAQIHYYNGKISYTEYYLNGKTYSYEEYVDKLR